MCARVRVCVRLCVCACTRKAKAQIEIIQQVNITCAHTKCTHKMRISRLSYYREIINICVWVCLGVCVCLESRCKRRTYIHIQARQLGRHRRVENCRLHMVYFAIYANSFLCNALAHIKRTARISRAKTQCIPEWRASHTHSHTHMSSIVTIKHCAVCATLTIDISV